MSRTHPFVRMAPAPIAATGCIALGAGVPGLGLTRHVIAVGRSSCSGWKGNVDGGACTIAYMYVLETQRLQLLQWLQQRKY